MQKVDKTDRGGYARLMRAGHPLRAFVSFAYKTKDRIFGCKAVERGGGGREVGDIDILCVCGKNPSEQGRPGRHVEIVAHVF